MDKKNQPAGKQVDLGEASKNESSKYSNNSTENQQLLTVLDIASIDNRLTPYDFIILHGINRPQHKGYSVGRLAKVLGVSRTVAVASLKKLVQLGYLDKRSTYDQDGVFEYTLKNLDLPASCMRSYGGKRKISESKSEFLVEKELVRKWSGKKREQFYSVEPGETAPEGVAQILWDSMDDVDRAFYLTTGEFL